MICCDEFCSLSEVADESEDAALSQSDTVRVTGEVREFELLEAERKNA